MKPSIYHNALSIEHLFYGLSHSGLFWCLMGVYCLVVDILSKCSFARMKFILIYVLLKCNY